MPKLKGFKDEDLHPQILEALKALEARQDDYHRALASLDAQFVKPLHAANDGDSDECVSFRGQCAAVRAKY